MTRILAIASTTYREAARQGVLWVLTGVFGGLILTSSQITLFSLGEEAVMIREMGLASIALCSFLLVLLMATGLIRREIENQTILTLVSKPVGRASILLGKFLGILAAVGGAMTLLALLLVLTLWWDSGLPGIERQERQAGYRHRRAWIVHQRGLEGAPGPAEIQAGWQQIPPYRPPDLVNYVERVRASFLVRLWPMVQGAYLVFLQAMILAAVCAVLSIRLRFMLSAVASFAFFTCGHLTLYLRERVAREESGLLTRAVTEVLYRVLPNLETYNLGAVVARPDGSIPGSYLVLATGSALLYTLAALLVGIVLFERTEAAGDADR